MDSNNMPLILCNLYHILSKLTINDNYLMHNNYFFEFLVIFVA